MRKPKASASSRRSLFSRKLLASAALAIGAASSAQGQFTITLDFSAALTVPQQQVVIAAKEYWEGIISGYSTTGPLTGVTLHIDTFPVDGAGGALAYATNYVTQAQGGHIYAKEGDIVLDSGDAVGAINDGSLLYIVRHEMGHAIGFSSSYWADNNLTAGQGTVRYFGEKAIAAWRIEFNNNQSGINFVPLEDEGGPGTQGSHWDERQGFPTGYVSRFNGMDFANELQTGIANPPMFTSNVTLGGLVDLGLTLQGARPAVNGVYLFDNAYLAQTNNTAAGTLIWYTLDGNNSLLMRNVADTTVFGIMTANTFTGGTTINSGTLIVADANALGTGNVLVDGGRLDTTDNNLVGIGTLTLRSGSITGEGGSINASAYNVESGTISTVLAGSGALTKTTAGSVTLSGANTFSGGVFLNQGLLTLGNASALGTGITTLATGTTLDIADVNVATIADVNVDNANIIGTTGTLDAPQINITGGSISAKLAGAGLLSKTGAGQLVLSGDNSGFSGNIVLADGTVVAGSANALGTGIVTVAGSTLTIAAPVVNAGAFVLASGTVGGAGKLAAASYDLRSGTVAAGFTGSGVVTKSTTGTVDLNAGGDFTGNVNITGGTLRANAAGSLGSGVVDYSLGALVIGNADAARNATLNIGATGTLTFGAVDTVNVGALTGSGIFTLVNDAAAPLSLNLTGANDAIFTGSISGTGSVIKSGTASQTFSGASSYTGETRVTGGRLIAGSAQAFGTGDIRVTGGTLDVGGFNLSTGSLTLDGGTIAGAGSLQASAFDLRSGTMSVSLGGSGAVTKSGTGAITLSVANTYLGGTTVNDGVLNVANASALGTGGVVVSGGILNPTVDVTVSSLTVTSGVVAGSRTLTVNSDVDLRGGAVVANVRGTVALNKTGADDALLAGVNSFANGVHVLGGRLVVAGQNSIGSTAVDVASGAALQFGDDTSYGAVVGGSDVTLAGGDVAFNLASATRFNRRLVGTGNVTQNGTGAVTLTSVAYTGTTTVNNGTLSIAENLLSGINGALVTNGAGTLELTNVGTTTDYSRAITGTGSVAFSGSGQTRLTGPLDNTGSVVVNTGKTLSLGRQTGESAALAASLVAIRSGATLRGSGTIAGSLANAGTLTPGFSPGTITLGGDFTNTGTLIMEIDAAGPHDQINYAGTAHLGGTLNIVYLGGTPADGTVVALLNDTNTADGLPSLTGNFAATNVAGGGVLFNSGNGLAFQVGGTLATIPGLNLDPRLAPFAAAVESNPALGNVLNAVTVPVSQLGSALRRSAPLGLVAGVSLPIAEAANNVDQLRRHLDDRRFERVAADLQDWSPYVYGTGQNVNVNDKTSTPFYDYYTVGGAVGADRRMGGDFSLGVRVGYDNGHASFHESAGRLEQDRVGMTVYGSKLFGNRYYVDGGVFGGGSSIDTRRDTYTGRETGSTTGWDVGAFVNTGMVLPLNKKISFTPHAGFAFTHAETRGFGESGDALALAVESIRQDSLTARVGITGNAMTTFVGGMPLRLGMDASYVRELLDNETDVGADFATSPVGRFNTSAVTSVRHRLEVGPTLDLDIGGGQAIYASYRFDYAFGDAIGNRVDFGYRVRF